MHLSHVLPINFHKIPDISNDFYFHCSIFAAKKIVSLQYCSKFIHIITRPIKRARPYSQSNQFSSDNANLYSFNWQHFIGINWICTKRNQFEWVFIAEMCVIRNGCAFFSIWLALVYNSNWTSNICNNHTLELCVGAWKCECDFSIL